MRDLIFSLLGVALLAAAVMAYALALDGPLLFDDMPALTQNTLLQIDGATFDDWRVASLSSDAGPLRRPVAMFSFALNYVASGGFSPAGLKAVNLLIHLVIATLLFLLVVKLLRTPALQRLNAEDERAVALLAAAIWLLHPLHVSTVLYVVQRMAQLSTLFVLLGLLVFVRYRLRWAEQGASPGELLAATLWFSIIGAFAVFSKENGALLPWLIAVTEVTLFRGMWQGRARWALVRAGWLVFVIPLLLVLLIFLFSPEIIVASYGSREFTLSERLLTQVRILWQYAAWFFIPNITDMGLYHDDIALSKSLLQPWTTLLAILCWVVALCGAWLLRSRYPLILFSVLFYLVANSMESSFWPLEMVFEHRTYLPSVALALLAAAAFYKIARFSTRVRFSVIALGPLAILFFLLLARTSNWSEEVSYSRYNAANHPGSVRAKFLYGNALFKQYQRRDELDLSEEEVRALVTASRHNFVLAHRADVTDVAPYGMLYQIDNVFFSEMPNRVDWLDKMARVLQTRRLQPSDITALRSMTEFFGSGAGSEDVARFLLILDDLISRYPTNTKLLIAKYRLLQALYPGQSEQLLAILEQAVAIGSRSTYPYQFLLRQYASTGDVAAAYEAAGQWMRLDSKRRELPALRRAVPN